MRDSVIEQAKAARAEGNGDKLLLLPGWPWVIAAETALQELKPTPAVLRTFMEKIRIPIVSFYGSVDIEGSLSAPGKEAFDASPSPNKKFVIIEGADHSYRGHETRVQKEVVEWLKSQFTA